MNFKFSNSNTKFLGNFITGSFKIYSIFNKFYLKSSTF